MKKAYIAGKITGLNDYKENFERVEKALKNTGQIVMNPSILPEGFEQKDYHKICMAMIDCCDVVAFLPNWVDSKGSHLEYGYAKGTGKEILFL